jgi:hypothetical protein
MFRTWTRNPRRLLTPAIALAIPSALLIAALAFGQAPPPQGPASWFARPYELPKDVFDLPEFDRFRAGGKLNVEQAQAYLESLSDKNLPAAQRLFDVFAWKAFLALNSPAQPNGQPDTTKKIADAGGTQPLVWEFWQQSSRIFLPNGQRPTWPTTTDRSLDHFKAGWRQNTTVNEGKQAFSGPLIDQNGKWVHYVSLVNRREFDYLVQHELYNLEGQAEFVRNNRIEFPINDDATWGAIEIKLAWKTLTPSEVASNRFLVRRLPVVQYRPASAVSGDTPPPAHVTGRSTDNTPSPTSQTETLGLIGMHISMRTRSSPQWIWSTFEQIDNIRLDLSSGDAKHPLPSRPSLANPNDPEALVGANILPAYNATDAKGQPINDWDESKPLPPVEVLRLVPPPQGTQEVNVEVQRYLGSVGSVFRFYELNGTQWPKHPKAPAVPGGNASAPESIIRKMPGQMVPVYLINSTMETYFQKGYQQAGPLEQDDRLAPQFSVDTTMVFGTESCVGCHYSAGACIGFRRDSTGKLILDPNGNKIPIFGQNANGGQTANANFSWLLQIEAKSKSPKQ